jgi:hypothetical protein
MGDQPNVAEWLAEQTQDYPLKGVTRIGIDLYSTIERIAELRGLTVSELGSQADVPVSLCILANNPEDVTLGALVRLANALGMQLVVELIQTPDAQ